jgi:hypothetical protein
MLVHQLIMIEILVEQGLWVQDGHGYQSIRSISEAML